MIHCKGHRKGWLLSEDYKGNNSETALPGIDLSIEVYAFRDAYINELAV